MQSDKNKNDVAWWLPALEIFARLSAWIAVPVIFAIILGKWLDRKFGTMPWLFLTCVGFAFLISMFGVVTNASKEFKKISDETKKSSDDNTDTKL